MEKQTDWKPSTITHMEACGCDPSDYTYIPEPKQVHYSEQDFKLFARQYYREIKMDKSNLLWDELADKCLEQFKKK